MMIRAWTLLAFIAAAGFTAPPSPVATPTTPVVRIAAGQVRGMTHDGLDIFRGIPYAAAPVGPLRWRPPQPVKPWAGVRPAAAFGHVCMQVPSPGDATPRSTAPSEDCLYLNVWTPTRHKQKLPVLVWIHGGGYVNGGSSSPIFDGAVFARQGLVFVSFNYRLGRFGFFAFPALAHEDKLFGNYAFMDQIAALRWVKHNIAAFGGDPDQVTVFGESAGGMSVNVLLTSPLARGLFDRAIVESGAGRDNFSLAAVPLDRPGSGGEPSAEQAALAFARSMGIRGDGAAALAALRKLPAAKIVDGLEMYSLNQQIYRQKIFTGPVVDGRLIASPPEQVFKEGRQAKVPVIVGATSADLGFVAAKTLAELFAPFDAHAAQARAAFDPDHSQDVELVGRRIGGVRDMLEPARFVARSVAATGQPAWEYRYSYIQTGMRAKLRGAPHFSEVPLVFESLRHTGGDEFSHASAADLAMAHTLNAYWVNFAKTGNPNGPGLPHWPTITADGDELMNFTIQGARAETDPVKAQLDLVEAVQK